MSQEAFPSFPKPPSHAQKGGRTAGGACFFFIACGRPICRADAPITRTSSQPFEGWVIGDALEHPAEIIVIIRRKTQIGSVLHNCRQRIEGLAGHKAPFRVAQLWPWVRKQDEHAIDRGWRQRREHQPRVINKNPDVGDVTAFDKCEKPGDTGLENFAAYEADLRMAFGLNSKMLASAETDLKPNVPLRGAEGHIEFKSAFLRDGQSKLRQQLSHPDNLFRAKPSPAAASEDQLTVCQPHESEKSEGASQLVRQIKPLPREAAVGCGRSAEMTIGRRGCVDRFI
jgi:hypothetical protein